MGSIAVVGSANMDLVVRQPKRAEPGETIFGTRFSTGPGGKGLNQAVAAARAGGAVAFLGAVGSDDFGARLRARLESDGVDTARLRTVAEATGIAQISVTDDGENTIVVVPGANSAVDFDDADRAVIAGASHLVVQLERPHALLVEAMRFARDRGVVTVLTPAPAREGIDDLIALADILVPNEGEATLLAGALEAESAAIALSRHAGLVIVTLGERGALVARGGEIVRRVAPRPVVARDTTGAGDTFVGVLVAWLAAGEPLAGALHAATVGASLAVTREGAADSMPSRDEILAALAGQA